MGDSKYLISEMSKILQLEPHVLRYWEEELEFDIARNEMGHRYYTEKDLRRFLKVKELKKNGMQLREIKSVLEKNMETIGQAEQPRAEKRENISEQRDERKIVDFFGKDEKKEEHLSKEEMFYEIMERMIGQIAQSDKKEARYRKLDEAIRRHQQSRKLVAATEEIGKGSGRKKVRKAK